MKNWILPLLLLSTQAHAIHGGSPVGPGQYEAVVGIVVNDPASGIERVFCSGTLISPTQVLTAAHCIFDGGDSFYDDSRHILRHPELVKIYIGEGESTALDAGWDLSNKRLVGVSGFHYVRNYLTDGTINGLDLAVFDLAEPVLSIPSIPLLPAALVRTTLVAGAQLKVLGFGVTPENQYGRKYVANVQVSNIRKTKRAVFVTAGGEQGGICAGDSGGALLARSGDTDYLVGVSSSAFGDEYCDNSPAIFYFSSSPAVHAELGIGGRGRLR